MDRGPLPSARVPGAEWRPPGCDRIALVLQGGGALGAYQAGVYQALHEAGLEPDWIAGVSIGGINGAIIAGNSRDRRLDHLQQFWDKVTSRPTTPFVPDGDDLRRIASTLSSLMTMTYGQPGFFTPRPINAWFSPRGSKSATSFYDSSPLRETLRELVDFDLLNSDGVRYACGAVNVRTGNFAYFDSRDTEIGPEHVMASGALPPALPMVQVGTDWYWDGGVVSNTPLQYVFENMGCESTLVFQVDLFSARGPLPRDMRDVLARQKDIQYSSRTRMVSDVYTRRNQQNLMIKRLLEKVPEGDLSDEEITLKRQLEAQPKVKLVHLIYRPAAWETQAKDYEFSGISMREHWDSGYRDTAATLKHKAWLSMTEMTEAVETFDVHHIES